MSTKKQKRNDPGKGQRGEPNWKYVERVVALLEQAIVPGARVEHDGKLLDYVSGTMRQCDVVIRQGNPPRETLTIVEVQDRGRRVTLPIFEGWCRKREKVRAQHLICVSQKGFSGSVRREAGQLGGTVHLLELTELEEAAWPVKFKDGKWAWVWPEIEIDSFTVKTVDNKLPGRKFKRGDVDFTRDGRPVQIGHIFDEYFPTIECPPNGAAEGYADQRIEFGRDDVVIMNWADDSSRVDTITRRVRVRTRREVFNISISEYRQCDYDGALAWSVAGTANIDGQELETNLIFTPLANGLLQLAAIRVPKVLSDMPLASMSINFEHQDQVKRTALATFPRPRRQGAA